jgi:hypothetical protein
MCGRDLRHLKGPALHCITLTSARVRTRSQSNCSAKAPRLGAGSRWAASSCSRSRRYLHRATSIPESAIAPRSCGDRLGRAPSPTPPAERPRPENSRALVVECLRPHIRRQRGDDRLPSSQLEHHAGCRPRCRRLFRVQRHERPPLPPQTKELNAGVPAGDR